MAIRVLLAGPTAVGKTSLSLRLAREFGVPIVSVDARQCYRHMDIGTAKIGSVETRQVPHYNISNLDPREEDNTERFYRRVLDWEEQTGARYPFLLFAGGSTLYLERLFTEPDSIPPSEPDTITGLRQDLQQHGERALFAELKRVDPVYAAKMDGINVQRMVRALAVFRQTGRPFSSFHTRNNAPQPGAGTLVFVLTRSRSELYDRINRRVEQMMEMGLIGEVRALLERGYSSELNSLRTVGYREIIDYLRGSYALEEAVRLIKRNTRRYAKRQITWFRRWSGTDWLDLTADGEDHAATHMIRKIRAVVAEHKN